MRTYRGVRSTSDTLPVPGDNGSSAMPARGRVIVYTGKGGVGKTSVAAATAILCAERGLRTLVMSTDIAHSLGDAFDRTIGPEPTRLARDLWAQETDAYHKIRASWGAIQSYLTSFFQWR